MNLKAIAVIAFSTLTADPVELRTSYRAGVVLQIESETLMSMSTTDFEITADGDPVERPGRDDDGRATDWRRSLVIETVEEADEGRPVSVRREWRDVESGPEEGVDAHDDAPLEGAEILLTRDDEGSIEIESVEGDEPDSELHGALQLTLALDALLPQDGVEPGAEWELDNSAVRSALGLDLIAGLFPAPRREGNGRPPRDFAQRGGRQRGRRLGDSGARLLNRAEWDGTAILAEATEEWEGVECRVIEVELTSSGELPERERGRGGRDRSPSGSNSPQPWVAGSYEIEVSGRLLFAVELARPISLELEGTLRSERNTERQRGDVAIRMSSTREGTFTHRVQLTAEE